MTFRMYRWVLAALLFALVAAGACASGDDDDDDASDKSLSETECTEGMDAVYDCALVSVENGEKELSEEQAVGRCASGEDAYECFAQCGLDQPAGTTCVDGIIACIEENCRTAVDSDD